MRQIDKPEEQPTLGAPKNRQPPAEPVKRKISDNVSEVAGRMVTEIARNVHAPDDANKNPLKPGVP